MKEIESYCCALEDIGFCALVIEDINNCSLFALNATSTQKSIPRSSCLGVVDAAVRSGFPRSFTCEAVGDVRCRRFGDSCVLCWDPSTTERPSPQSQSLSDYCACIQPIFAQLPVLMLLVRAIIDENGKPDVEILAASNLSARYRGFSHSGQLVHMRSGRDMKRDPLEDLAFYRKSRAVPHKPAKRRLELLAGPTDQLATPFSIPGHESEEAYLLAGYDVSEWFEEVKASEARFRNMVENLPVIAYECEAKTANCVWVNKKFRESTGLSMTEIFGTGWHTTVAGNWVNAWEENMSGEEPFELEIQLRMLDGVHDYLCQMEPVKSMQGKVDRWFGTSTDITQKKESERTLLAANEQLVNLNKLKSVFISHISHEIRTPLNAIINMLQFLWDSPLDKEQRDYVSTCIGSSNLLLSLLNDCLDLSAIEAGKLTMSPITFDLTSLVLSSVDMFCDMAGAKGIQLWCQIARTVPTTAFGDPVRIHQVLSNLMSNACKYTESGAVLVKMDSEKDSNLVTFSVEDTGPGLNPEHTDSLFQPFSQLGGAQQVGLAGHGLGLAISSQLCKCMGGSLSMTPNSPHGCIFSFSLPIANSCKNPRFMHQNKYNYNVLVLNPDLTAQNSIVSLLNCLEIEMDCFMSITCASSQLSSSIDRDRIWDLIICPQTMDNSFSFLPTTLNARSCFVLQDLQHNAASHHRSSSTHSRLIPHNLTLDLKTLPDPARRGSIFAPIETHISFIRSEITYPCSMPLHPIRFCRLLKTVLTPPIPPQPPLVFVSSRPMEFPMQSSQEYEFRGSPESFSFSLPTTPSQTQSTTTLKPPSPSPPKIVNLNPPSSSSPQPQCQPYGGDSATDEIVVPAAKPKILIAEDNLINQKVVRKMCVEGGFEPHIVEDGKQCVDKWLEDPTAFFCILMDINMPVMDGIEATQQIRRLESEQSTSNKIPIIALTANSMADSETSCKQAGMNSFLSKPVRLPVLMRALGPFMSLNA